MNEHPRQHWSDASMRREYVTPELVSGIVFVSVVIAVGDESSGIFDVFSITILSVAVFWATNVFAHTVADQRRRGDDDRISVPASVRTALKESRGYLYAAILPTIFLILGLFGGVRDGEIAYWIALWIQVALLALVGWLAFSGRGIAWYRRVLGSIATAALGVLAILLKIAVQ